MLMSDSKIIELVRSGVLCDARLSNVGPVSYDLVTKGFYVDGNEVPEVELDPGESVFVGSVETVHLPGNIAARIGLKNSRIRQGLSLEAPVYFPGHSTRLFFRVTNVSADTICLDTSKGIAQVMFETVDGVEHPYEGAFSDEFSFSGLASYENVYGGQVKKVEKKKEEILGIESRIYGNVLTLFGVFAAIFTLVNVNAGALTDGSSVSRVVVVDLMVLGGFSLLAAIIDLVVASASNRKSKWQLFAVAAISILLSVLLAA